MAHAGRHGGTDVGDLSAASEPAAVVFVGSDQALLEALSNGQREAVTALLERYGKLVWRRVLRVLGPEANLVDIVEEVFLRAWATARPRNARLLDRWMSALAVRCATRHVPRTSHRRRASDVAATSAPQGEPATLVKKVYGSLCRLPTQDRVVFSLRFVDGMDLVDVAHCMKMSILVARRRLLRAEQGLNWPGDAVPSGQVSGESTNVTARWEALGHRVALASDALVDARAGLLQVRHRLSTRSQAPGRPPWFIVSIGLALVLGTVLTLGWLRAPTVTGFQVDKAGIGVLGTTLGSDSSAQNLRFDEGSVLTLDAATKARVHRLLRSRAELIIEAGHARLEAVTHGSFEWRMAAGPFTATTRGGLLELDWTPSAQKLTVILHRGEVRMAGGLFLEPQPLREGQRLDVDATSGTFTVGPHPVP